MIDKKELKTLILTTIDFDLSINQRTHHLADFLKTRSKLAIAFQKTPGSGKKFLQKLKIMLTFKPGYHNEDGIVKITATHGFVPFSKFGVPADMLMVILDTLTVLLRSREKYDICIAQSPWSGVTGIILRKLSKVRFVVYEDLDLFPEFLKDGIHRRSIRWLENIAVKNCDLLVCIGQELADLRKRQFDKDAVISPNGADIELFSSAAEKPPHQPTFLYMGTLEDWCGADLPIKAMPKILESYPEARYIILGKGKQDYIAYLHKLAVDLNVAAHVIFMGHQPYEKLPRFMKDADIGVATFKPIPLMKYAFTLKIIEYLAAGLMVIGTDIGETAKVLSKTTAGVAIPYDEKAFVDTAISFLESPSKDQMKISGQQLAGQYDWLKIFQKEWTAINENFQQ